MKPMRRRATLPGGVGVNFAVGAAATATAVALWVAWGPIGGIAVWFAVWAAVILCAVGISVVRSKVANP